MPQVGINLCTGIGLAVYGMGGRGASHVCMGCMGGGGIAGVYAVHGAALL
jgi:hypothetical protein